MPQKNTFDALEENQLQKIGTLKCRNSAEIADSPVSIGFECLDREIFDPERCYVPLGKTGVKWARCQTGWNRCEQTKGVYNFAWLDSVVDRLRQQGIQPWFNVGYGNKLYMDNLYSDAAVGHVPLYYGEETWQAWCNFIRALARHFAGRVRYFEIWNESNISTFWQPKQADPLEYAKLVRETGRIIRGEIPDAKIGGCVSGCYSSFVIRFIESGIGSELDFFGIHPYCVQPEVGYRAHVEAIRRAFRAAGAGHVELWQGESGFASWFPENHWLHPSVLESERNQAVWQLRRYVLDMSLGMQRSSFFQAVDMMGKDYVMGDTTRKNPARHGILNGVTYTPKLSYYTFQRLATLFDGGTAPAELFATVQLPLRAEGSRESRLLDTSIMVNTFRRNGYPVVEYHLAEDMQFDYPGMGDLALHVHAPGLKTIDHPVLIDLLTGTVYQVGEIKRDGSGLAVFSKLPLTDYPLLLTDRQAFAIEEK